MSVHAIISYKLIAWIHRFANHRETILLTNHTLETLQDNPSKYNLYDIVSIIYSDHVSLDHHIVIESHGGLNYFSIGLIIAL